MLITIFSVKYRAHGALIPIYEDKNASITSSRQPDLLKAEMKPWCNLGARAERNKENNAIPTKWTSMKVRHLLHIGLLLHLPSIGSMCNVHPYSDSTEARI